MSFDKKDRVRNTNYIVCKFWYKIELDRICRNTRNPILRKVNPPIPAFLINVFLSSYLNNCSVGISRSDGSTIPPVHSVLLITFYRYFTRFVFVCLNKSKVRFNFEQHS